ncbi:NifB/NifX family molybdenum-iron cluster-binding protein [Methanocalculus sp.]|uniref:NifB/NifX family molybdenum-iron cluster-binding protein n=1 Tax=Methanocalculus sp. TaxID=2004547 RepID=UPI002728EDA8|nr:NifB/NifX family molybdenum-iron cluster-binding protein [Methanocalculus sp.]MDO8841099.1 NifB/NifX family molybdenum-iron cluster-binding protein [Methanocalculus sp.]
MKIGIAMDGTRVSEHFGHCQKYAIFNAENSMIIRAEDLDSPGHEPGKLPRFLAEHGVNLVIAGGMGPRAIDLFHENGIDVILGVAGDVDFVAQEYIRGNLTPGESTCHHGSEEECGSEEKGSVICVTAKAPGMDAAVEERFGRAPFFTFIDLKTATVDSIPNAFADASGGVGPRAVSVVMEHGAQFLITGQMGGNAAEALTASGIKAYSYRGDGTVADAVKAYLAGNLTKLA